MGRIVQINQKFQIKLILCNVIYYIDHLPTKCKEIILTEIIMSLVLVRANLIIYNAMIFSNTRFFCFMKYLII